jgi:putative OPT family oligopeptide transporter
VTKTDGDGERIVRTGPYPELTGTAVIVGYGLGVLICLSIGYASLILGFSIEGSELAAILGFGILRGLLRRSSIIENNINQTIASAVNGASAGMMFTVPALFILGYPDFSPVLTVFHTVAGFINVATTGVMCPISPPVILKHPGFSPVLMAFACMVGGVMGIAFIIPLRKQMIDYERLTYPGGVAVATILKSPGAGVHKAMLLLAGLALSAAVHFGSQYMSQIRDMGAFERWNLGELIRMPDYMNGIWYVSLMTVGVGFISGRGGFSFVIGGFVCYWILAPILAGMSLLPDAGALKSLDMTMPEYLRLTLFRPVGIGMLIGGALTGIVLALPLIISAVRSMQRAAKMKTALSKDEMPIRLLYAGIGGAAILLFVISLLSVKQMGMLRGGLMALLGTVWIWVAGVVLSECIGRTNWSPLSGMTLIAVTILIVISSGLGGMAAAVSSVMVGAAACVAMAQATDLMLDLKTGYLVGASPKKQQMGQFLATWLGPIVVIVLIFVLHRAYGLGSDRLPAPQGRVLASTIEGILGGDVPWNKYLAGAGLGALLSSTGIGGLGILVGLGFYLGFDIVLTYSIGTVLRLLVDWRKGPRFSEEVGIPVAAGFIVGEALVGVGFALYFIFAGGAA